jgi:RimJ/RimL family protein N-acetyltransferase
MPGPAYLRSDSLTLRTVEEEDLAFIQEGFNDPRIRKNIGRYTPSNHAQQQTHLEERITEGENSIYFLICVDETPIGLIWLFSLDYQRGKGEIGLWITPDEWGNGYGTDAVTLIVDYGFKQLRLHKLIARVQESNATSKQIWDSLGFTQEGFQRDEFYSDGEYVSYYYFGILADEWDADSVNANVDFT